MVEELADQVISQLVPVFEAEEGRGVLVEAIAHELAATLASAPALEVLLKGDLDPSKATRAYRKARSLPENQFSAAEIAFYDRALQQTVHHLTTVADKLPTFDAKATAESLQRLSALTTDTGRIRVLLEDFRAERTDQKELEAGRIERYENRYRAALARNLNYVELLGFGHEIRRETKDLPLSVAYISLNATSQSSSGESGEAIPFATLLDRLGLGTGRLLVLGEAGSGKTTLFRWTAIEAARKVYEHLKQPEQLWPSISLTKLEKLDYGIDVKIKFGEWTKIPELNRTKDLQQALDRTETSLS